MKIVPDFKCFKMVFCVHKYVWIPFSCILNGDAAEYDWVIFKF
jgi:hypothetical protein